MRLRRCHDRELSVEPGGSRGFAGLPDFCPETCLQPARPSAPQAARRCGAVSSGGIESIDDVFKASLSLQTDFRLEVRIGTPTGLAVSHVKNLPDFGKIFSAFTFFRHRHRLRCRRHRRLRCNHRKTALHCIAVLLCGTHVPAFFLC